MLGGHAFPRADRFPPLRGNTCGYVMEGPANLSLGGFAEAGMLVPSLGRGCSVSDLPD